MPPRSLSGRDQPATGRTQRSRRAAWARSSFQGSREAGSGPTTRRSQSLQNSKRAPSLIDSSTGGVGSLRNVAPARPLNRGCERVSAGRLAHGLGCRHQIIATVLPPGRLVVSERARPLLAVADRRDARCIQAEVHEVAFRGIGAQLPERQVVLPRATFVAIPLDAKVLVQALPRQIEERLQRGSRF